ncbi:tryptophan synthase subunit alpha [Candidatus Bathyarchaeota archaeon]|nr:tryptophan synthase subunit alpha [Candidatus Bathyarchaeota archaeon]
MSKGKIPLAVGFGISKPSHIRNALANGAEGVIVGSILINIIKRNLGNKEKMLTELKNYAKNLKAQQENSSKQFCLQQDLQNLIYE